MSDEPVLQRYRTADRLEVFDFLRAMYSPDISARMISQWAWKYETNPFNPPEGPVVNIIRVDGKLIALLAGFRLNMWMGGIECLAECSGDWVVHPDFRRQKLWRRVGAMQPNEAAILFSWSRLPARVAVGLKWTIEPLTPLLKILDAGPLVEHFTHSGLLAAVGASASAVARVAGTPLRRLRGGRSGARRRLEVFDDSVDALWERAWRPQLGMLVRDHRYLNWRYCQRPDATYTLFGIERESQLAGFLVARAGTHQGMPWGYLVDFLAPENSNDVLSSLIDDAIEDFRRIGVAAVSCYATDPATRNLLFRHGFFPVRQSEQIRVFRYIRSKRTDLSKFATLRQWYMTMGDGDFEMSF